MIEEDGSHTVVRGQHDGGLLPANNSSLTKQTGRDDVNCMSIHTAEYIVE
jgi:hypothetical protein